MAKMKLPPAKAFHFDVDEYLNPYVPRNQVSRLPFPLARLLGHHAERVEEPGNLLVCWWSFIGAFIGILVVGAVFKYSSAVQELHPPVVVASLGAAAILDYNTIYSPLSQPRNSVIGHTLCAIVGVAITKLFALRSNYDDIEWIAGAMATGLASSVMLMTNTIHPPGGATALLAATEPTVRAMGWSLIPLVLLATVLMLGVALVINNIQRRFPSYWWTPGNVGREHQPDLETAAPEKEDRKEGRMTLEESVDIIVIGLDQIVLPPGFWFGPEQEGVLEVLRDRLREYKGLQKLEKAASRSGSESTVWDTMEPS